MLAARYGLGPYITHIRFVFKGLKRSGFKWTTHSRLLSKLRMDVFVCLYLYFPVLNGCSALSRWTGLVR